MAEVGKAIMAGSTPMEFTAPLFDKRRIVRAMKNPMDKCTLVSIFPKETEPEKKPTIEPGTFQIPVGTYENPGILVIGGSSWWKDYDPEQPMLEIPVSSISVADSIIKDFCNGLLGCNMGDAMPGFFFAMGEHTVLDIKTNFKMKLAEAKMKQDNWFKVLVRLADSLWARTGGNPLAIMDEMRLAARELNLNDKPWLKDFQVAELVRCNACGNLKNPAYPVCPTCKAIDNTHPLSKELKFA